MVQRCFAYLPQRHVWFDRTKTLVTSQVFKEHEPDFNVRPSKFFSVRDIHEQETGGADRDRTGDPLLAKQVLSQLS